MGCLGEVHALLVQQTHVLLALRRAHQLPRRIFDAVERPTAFPATVFVSVAPGHLTLLAVGHVLQRSLELAVLDALHRGVESGTDRGAEFQHVYNEERPHRALGRRTPGEAYRAKGKALPDPELAARTQTKLDEQRRRETTAGSPGATRRKPIPKDKRAEPARADVTIGPGIHRIDRRGCVTQNNIAGKRRIFNLGKHNAGRMAELLIDHGRAVATDLETGEILADQTLDATREYQYRKPANDVNDAPRQM